MASRAMVGLAARSLASISEDVTLRQYRALVILDSEGSQSVSALAERLDVNPSTATRLCDRLVRKRLIRRQSPPGNRREVRLAPTPAGRSLVAEVMARRRREVQRVLGRISPESRARLAEGLWEFASAAGEIPDQTCAAGWSFPATD